MNIAVNYQTNDFIYQMILAKLSNNKWHNLSNTKNINDIWHKMELIAVFFLTCMKH